MRYLNGVNAQASNRRHRRTGHVFEARYRSLVIQRDSQLKRVVRYVALNPVRAHLVNRAIDWPSLAKVLASAGGSPSAWRQAVYAAHVTHGYPQSEIARHVGLDPSIISRLVRQAGGTAPTG